MEVLRWDNSFGYNVFLTNVSYGNAGDCFSKALCMPRGLFNIDLTGTGLRIKPGVSWGRGAWPAEHKKLYTIHEDLYAQVIDANCGAYCGSCYPNGPLYLEVVVPHAHLSHFGKKILSLIDTSDQGKSKRNLDLSNVCSEPVGLEDGRIPDSSFSASSFFSSGNVKNEATKARLNDPNGGWRAKDNEVEPWLQVDLLFLRLVTGFATRGGPNRYLKTYFLSFGFAADQLMVYLDVFKQRKVFVRNKNGITIDKKVLHKPFFARHVRFTLLTWETSAKMNAEIYVCPR
ncbi:venom prothrombin activator pseutarin-C non-catalytic subunit-like, partial [Paramuricea clavata]